MENNEALSRERESRVNALKIKLRLAKEESYNRKLEEKKLKKLSRQTKKGQLQVLKASKVTKRENMLLNRNACLPQRCLELKK